MPIMTHLNAEDIVSRLRIIYSRGWQSIVEGALDTPSSQGNLRRYLLALAVIGVAFVVRLSLNPILSDDGFLFPVFYPAILLIAIWFGLRAAMAAAPFSVLLAYWAFAAPQFSMGYNQSALLQVGFFMVTIYANLALFSKLKANVVDSRNEMRLSEQLSQGHAALFREFNERTTYHLQLVSTLLGARQFNAEDEVFATALSDASHLTARLAHLHRNLSGGGQPMTDISSFTQHIVRDCAVTAGCEDVELFVSDEVVLVPTSIATSIAIIVLEETRRIFGTRPSKLDVVITHDQHQVNFDFMSTADQPRGAISASSDFVSGQIVDTAVAQLRGTITRVALLSGEHISLSMAREDAASNVSRDWLGYQSESATRH